ncbi:MAG: hypothetical protein QGG40_11705, partial [Myxococcota bacterium]|nr:hypothetical protein [Myxococcota bacterium]
MTTNREDAPGLDGLTGSSATDAPAPGPLDAGRGRDLLERVEVCGPIRVEWRDILSPTALAFVADLVDTF